ncbi:MAG: response regulator [Dehalococcoidia bacterium]
MSLDPIGTLLGVIADLVGPLAWRMSEEDPLRDLRKRRLLWVDDHPEGNPSEAAALRSMGLSITTVGSNEDALRSLARDRYDLVISDMRRDEGATAGYDLLQAIRKDDQRMPFVIYTGSDSPDHRRRAIELGAQGSTSRPNELLGLVVNLLRGTTR